MPKRILALMLALLCTMGSFTVVSARASDYIDCYEIKIIVLGNGQIRVMASVNGTHGNMTQIGIPTIALYEKNGNTFTAVASYNSLYKYNALSYGYYFTYDAVVGKEYRAAASFMAMDSTGRDSRNGQSTIVIAQ